MHENSLRCWDEEQKNLGKRAQMILELLRRTYAPYTDREVLAMTGNTDPNYVRPRLTELVKSGLVIECETKMTCTVTGKKVRLVRATTPKEFEMLGRVQEECFT